MTAEKAKAIVAEAWKQTCAGPGEFDDYAVDLIQKSLSDAFDLGFKAAGGTMIPDGARDHVELSLPRAVINYVANAVEASEEIRTTEEERGVAAFLETISIYRRRK